MSDIYAPEVRSFVMRQIRAKNTKPEKVVRSLLHKSGYRFRIHAKELPGSPDILMPKHRLALFVNGCFWHQHKHCKLSKMPKSNRDYWMHKLLRNIERDKENVRKLRAMGWKVLTLWECTTVDTARLAKELKKHITL